MWRKLFVVMMVLCAVALFAQVPRTMNYQGKLTDVTGVALPGPCNITFKIYNSLTGGDSLWAENYVSVTLTKGLFDVILGQTDSIDLPFDEQYFIELWVDAEQMSPRIPFATVPYAFRAAIADSAIGGSGGGNWTVTDSVLYTNNFWGIARGGAGNVLYGNSAYTHVNLGVACITGTDGIARPYCTVGGGLQNTASDWYTTIAGGHNNEASNQAATVGGGFENTASYSYATVSGGEYNNASSDWSTVGGGEFDTTKGFYSGVFSGYSNLAGDEATDTATVIAGGYNNSAIAKFSAIPGGRDNDVSGEYSFAYGNDADVATDYTARFFSSDFPGSLIIDGNTRITGGINDGIDFGTAGQVLKTNGVGDIYWDDGSGTDNDWTRSGNLVYTFNTTDSVGIGTATPGAKLEVAGHIWQTGTGNSVFIGEGAGANDDLANRWNVFIGNSAGFTNTIGYKNTANGYGAFYFNTTGSENTANGYTALRNNTTGNCNTANGKEALFTNTEGYQNTASGCQALHNNVTGNNNTASGTNALYSTNGSNNTAVGLQAGDNITTGSNNIIIGANVDAPSATADNQMYLGGVIYGDLSSGYVGIGTTTPAEKLDVDGNVLITGGINDGIDFGTAGQVLKTDGVGDIYWANDSVGTGGGSDNDWTRSGNYVYTFNTTDSVGIGTATPTEKLDVNGNATIGGHIGIYNTGRSVFIGQEAGANDDLTNNDNIAVGYEALRYNTTGSLNTANGFQVLYSNTQGSSNTATGANALRSNTTGNSNTANGNAALYWNTTGNSNTANGKNALHYNSIGYENTATGYDALHNNTTGSYNAASGYRALFSNTEGSYNTASGFEALSDVNPTVPGEGEYNTGLGYQAGDNITTGSNNIIIGANVDAPVATGNDQLNIGNTIYGDLSTGKVGIGTTTPAEKLDVDGNIRITGGINDGTDFGTAGQVLKTDGVGDIYWANESGAGGSPDSFFIFNQDTAAQDADYWIDGHGRIQTSTAGDSALVLRTTAADAVGLHMDNKYTGLKIKLYPDPTAGLARAIDIELREEESTSTHAIYGVTCLMNQYGTGVLEGFTAACNMQNASSTSSGYATKSTMYAKHDGDVYSVYARGYRDGGSGDLYGVYSYASTSPFPGPSGGTHYGIYAKAEEGVVNWAGYFDGNVNIVDTLTSQYITLGGITRNTWPGAGGVSYCGSDSGATPSTQYGRSDSVARCDHTHWGQEWYGDSVALAINSNQIGSEIYAVRIDAVQNGSGSEYHGFDSKLWIDGNIGGSAIWGESEVRDGNGSSIGIKGVAYNDIVGSSNQAVGVMGWSTGRTNGSVYGGVFTGICSDLSATGNLYGLFSQAIGNSGKTHYGIYAKAENGATNWAGYFDGNVNIVDTLTSQYITLGGVTRDSWPSGTVTYCGSDSGATPSTQYGHLSTVARCDHTHWGQQWYGDGTALEINANQTGSELHAIYVDAVQNGSSSEFRGISSKLTIDGTLGGNAIIGEVTTGSGDGSITGVRGFASNANVGSSTEALGIRGIGTGKTNGNIYGGAFWGICDEATATGDLYGVHSWATSIAAAPSGKTHYGIYAKATDGIYNWAGYFDDGDVNIQNILIFDEVSYGTDGPGLRANAGNLEYRNDGGSWNTLGSATGVTGIRSNANPYLTGDVTLQQGTNVTLSQAGNIITINSTGGSGLWTDVGAFIGANNNAWARVYDDGGSYGFCYNGTNTEGGYFTGSSRGVRGAYSSDTNRWGSLGSSSYGAFGQYNASIYGFLGSSSYGVYGMNGTQWGALGTSSYGAYGQSDASIWGALGGGSFGAYAQNGARYGYIGTGFVGVEGHNGAGNVGWLAGFGYGAYGEYSGNYGYLGSGTYGVYGSGDGGGVKGESSNGDGVTGIANLSTKSAVVGKNEYYNTWGGLGYRGYGVWGYEGSGTRAGYFDGDVQVVGNLTKSSGSFLIDHPLDPYNKYLYHSFVESPDMMNVYNGNIATDENGFATVELPDYFTALNKDFRYQLTVIGEFAQAIIADEIKENSFRIKTDKPNIKVSWQVTGIRQDPWANMNRIIPEVEKTGDEKGQLLHPEVMK